MICSHVTNLSLGDVITKIVNCAPLHWLFFLQLTQQIEELTAERTKLVKTLTVLREKFDATVAENSKRGNLVQDLKEEVKVNFLANQVSF